MTLLSGKFSTFGTLASASRVACPGSVLLISDSTYILHILFYVSAAGEPRPLDAEHLLHYNYQHGHAVQLITAGNVRI